MQRKRLEYIRTLFPEGIPRLWCPPLTHFDSTGALDERRISAHLSFLAPSVKGVLVPGTTGEGWDLSDAEASRLLHIVLPIAEKLDLQVLVGILKPSARQMVDRVHQLLEEFDLNGVDADRLEALRRNHLAGFTFCAPHGSRLAQEQIEEALRSVLQLGLPSALYQLPQVTGNEIDPTTAQKLALEFPNLLLMKDSSGNDQVLSSGLEFNGLLFFRGAEGDYWKWYSEKEQRYDGFLLSSANGFPRRLAAVVASEGGPSSARALSETLSTVIEETFQAVRTLDSGNPFTNANKAIDHFNAFGSGASRAPAPRIHDGTTIPREVLDRVGRILDRYGLLSKRGYLDGP